MDNEKIASELVRTARELVGGRRVVHQIMVELLLDYFGEEDEAGLEALNGSVKKSWRKYVTSQRMGECQGVCSSVLYHNFPGVKSCFGHITNDDGEEMTHHWLTINGNIYEFSKGTLRGYVKFDDLYDVEVDDESIYEKAYCR